MKNVLFCLVILTASVLVQPAGALGVDKPDPTKVALSEFDQANRDWIDQHAEVFEDADAVVLFDRIRTTYKDDGSAVTTEEILIHFRKASAAAQYRALSYDFNPRTAHIRFLDARIYREDTSRIDVLPMSDVFTVKAPAEMIYWNFDAVICPVPAIENGDALYYRIERRGLNLAYLADETPPEPPAWDRDYVPPQPGYFMDTLYFDHEFPTVEKTYDLRGPRSKPLQFATGNGTIECSLKFSGDEILYRFAAKNRPGFTEEPFSPGFSISALKLAVASHPSWEMKSQWAFEHNEPQFVISDEMRREVESIIAGAKDDTDKMARLLHWVAEEIRYLGLDMGEGEGHMVHRTDDIFRERAGVCKDKAAILVSMLRAAGFDAYFVMTLAMEPTLDVPADDKFNHGVVAVRQASGWLFLDPTWAPQNRPLFNYLEQEQPVLIGAPEGCPLMQVPYSPPEQSPMQVDAVTSVDRDGTMHSVIDVKTDGYMDGRFRDILTVTPETTRGMFLSRVIEAIAPNATIHSRSFSDPRDFTSPMTLHFEISVPESAVPATDSLAFVPLLSRQFFGKRYESDYLHADVETDERTQSLELSCTRHIRFTETIQLPSGCSPIELPKKTTLDSPTLKLDYSVESPRKDRLIVRQDVSVMKRITPPDQIDAMLEVVEALTKIRTTPMVFIKPASSSADPASPVTRSKPAVSWNLPEYPARIDRKETRLVAQSDGSVTEVYETDARAFTEQGRDQFADQTFVSNGEFQTIRIEESYVEKTDGERIAAPQTAINSTLAGEVLRAPDYRRIVNTSASLIGVEYGDLLHFRIVRESASPMSTGIDHVIRISDAFPTGQHDVQVTFAGASGSYALLGGSDTPRMSTDAGNRVVAFSFEKPDAVQEEPMRKRGKDERVLVVSSFAEDDWAGRLEPLRKSFFEGTFRETPEPDDDLDELIDLHTDPMQRIAGLFEYLNDRCVTIEVHARRFNWNTRSIDRILETGYGHPLDKLKALRALVEKAGGRFQLVFAGYPDAIARKIPSLTQFPEMLGLVTLDARSCFVDPGEGILDEASMAGKTILTIDRESHALRDIASPLPNDRICSAVIRIDAAKSSCVTLDATIRNPSGGSAATAIRDDAGSWMKKTAADYLKKPTIKKSAVTELAPETKGACAVQFAAAGTLETKDLGKSRIMVSLKLPSFPSADYAKAFTVNQPRHTPALCRSLADETVQFRFQYPKSWTFRGTVPDAQTSISTLNWSRQITHDPKAHEIAIELRFRPQTNEIAPEAFPEWVRSVVSYYQQGALPLFFDVAPPDSTAGQLEADSDGEAAEE